MVGFISVLRIQRAVSIGNTEESVGLGAMSELGGPVCAILHSSFLGK